jgi:hypothetical protein
MCLQLSDMDPALIELFVDGNEDGLPDAGRLDGLGLGSGSVVFMLQRVGWRWTEGGSDMTLSGDGGLVAACNGEGWQLATGGLPMTEGRHFWEVQLTDGNSNTMVGAVRPGLDHDKEHHNGNDAYYIWGYRGALCGNGKYGDEGHRPFATGDRIGVLLDLDAGWVRFFCNDTRCGPGFTEGVTGPLVRAAQFGGDKSITALPSAAPPEGAGDAAAH